jgi:hypothetical protein
VRGDLDDEVGVQSCRDPVEKRDRGDHAAGFEARKRGLGHASPGGEFDLGQAECEAAFADSLADEVGAPRRGVAVVRSRSLISLFLPADAAGRRQHRDQRSGQQALYGKIICDDAPRTESGR